MLSAKIEIDGDFTELTACSSSVHWRDNSFISKFLHPNISIASYSRDDYWAVLVWEVRSKIPVLMASGEEAATRGHSLQIADEGLLHSAAQQYPGEITMIEGRRSAFGNVLRLITNGRGTCPLYASARKGILTLHWDFAVVAANNPCPSLDLQVFVQATLQAVHTTRTPFQHVVKLPAGTVATWRGGTMDIQTPRYPEYSRCSSQDQDEAIEVFAELLRSDISASTRRPQSCFVELSGGLDSSSLACVIGETLGAGAFSGGIMVEDDDLRSSQTERRNAIIEAFDLNDYAVDIRKHLPIFHPSTRCSDYGLPMYEGYIEAFDSMWLHAQKGGQRLIFSGMGGDELFPIFGDEPIEDSATPIDFTAISENYLKCLTPMAQEATQELLNGAITIDKAQATTLLGMERHSSLIMRHNQWPIYPFANTAIIEFSRTLPLELRVDKSLLRRLITQKMPLAHKSLFTNYPKEKLSSAAALGLASNYKNMIELIKTSPLIDLRVIDPEETSTQLEEFVRGERAIDTAHISGILAMDKFVRTYF